MPQAQRPIYPPGDTLINAHLAVEKKDARVTHCNGTMPVFSPDEADRDTFRRVTRQFYVNGNAPQAEICRAFSDTPLKVKRAVKKYREQGAAGFYKPRNTRGATLLTPDVLTAAQRLLEQGDTVTEVANAIGIKRNTVNKARLDKRLQKAIKKKKTAMSRNRVRATKVGAVP